jgi:hypothetical protein
MLLNGITAHVAGYVVMKEDVFNRQLVLTTNRLYRYGLIAVDLEGF